MTHKFNLIRKAQGTNSQFHLDGKLIDCVKKFRSGLGDIYTYSTNDLSEARRLQIVHGFKLEIRSVRPPIDTNKAQIKKLASKISKEVEVIKEVEVVKVPKPRTKSAKKKQSEIKK